MAQDKTSGAKVDVNVENLLARLRKDPQDVRSRIKLAELYYKKGERNEAIQQYILTAQAYGDLGFHSKAVAVYKQVLNLDPNNTEVYAALAELYKILGLTGEVMSHYRALAQILEQEGETTQALAVIAKMADLEPGNVDARLALAGKYHDAGLVAQARDEFRKAITLIEGRKPFPDIRSTYELYLTEGRADPALVADYGQLMLRNAMGDSLVKFLDTLAGDVAGDPTVRRVRAEALHALGRESEAASELDAAVAGFDEAGDESGRASATRLRSAWGRPGGAPADDSVGDPTLFESADRTRPGQTIREVDVFGDGAADAVGEQTLDAGEAPDVYQEVESTEAPEQGRRVRRVQRVGKGRPVRGRGRRRDRRLRRRPAVLRRRIRTGRADRGVGPGNAGRGDARPGARRPDPDDRPRRAARRGGPVGIGIGDRRRAGHRRRGGRDRFRRAARRVGRNDRRDDRGRGRRRRRRGA